MEQSNDIFSGINWLATGFISLIIGLVMGILGNLLTEPIKNRLASFTSEKTKKRLTQLEAELEKISEFASNPNTLYLTVLSSVVYIIFITLVAFVINDLYESLVTAIQAFGPFKVGQRKYIYFPEYLYVIGQFIGGILYLIGVIEAISVYKLIKKVQDFPSYREDIEEMMENLSKKVKDREGVGEDKENEDKEVGMEKGKTHKSKTKS